MASDDFSIKTKITLDTKNYEAGIKKAESETQKFSSSLSGVTKLLKSTFALAGISVGTKAIVNFGKEAVKSAESANKTLNILNNTLKVTGASAWTTSEDLVKMSEDIAYSTNYTVGEIQDMQSVLLGFKNITGDTFREASDAITDMATVMGMDLKSAVQTVGKALDDPIKGLDSLRRQGFAFTEEQKEQLKQLVENGEQLKAQKIILDELNTTYGGSAKSAQSSFDKQRDAVISFKETLGNQLIPVLDVFAEKSATSFSTLTEKIKTIDFSEIAGTVEYSVQVITEYFGVFYNNAKELVKGLAERFGDVEISLDTVKDAVYNSLNDIYKQMQIAFGFIKALINGDWKLAWEYAKIYVLNVCKKILDGLDDLLKKMPDLVNGAIKGLNAYYEAQDKVLIEWLHLPEKYFKAPRIGTYDGKHFIDTSELQKQIDEATRIIEEATGKQVTISLTGLEQIDTNRKKYQKKAEAGEIHLTNTTEIEVKKRTTTTEKILKNFIDSIKKKVADKEGFYSGLFENITSAFTEMFSMLGENLAGAGHSFEDFASVALNALSEVLKSISAQLSAIAVLKFVTHDYANATIALAGATASMVASGVASQVTKSLTQTKDKIDAVGDSANKAGKDLVYFKKRLEEITSGITTSSRNLVASVSNLRQEWIDAKEKANEAYEAYRKSADADPRGILSTKTYKLQKAYKELQETVYNYFESYKNASKSVLNQLKEEVTESESLVQSYKDIYSSIQKYQVAQVRWNLMTPEQRKSDKTDYILRSAFGGDLTKTLYGQLEEYRTYINILLNEQKVSVQKLLTDVYDQLSNTGKNIGDKLVNSIINGAEKADFLGEMKSYIRENLLKIAIYTESFQDKLAEVGVLLAKTLNEGIAYQMMDMSKIRKELNNLYDSAVAKAKVADKIINSAFGDIGQTVEETTEQIEESVEVVEKTLTRFEELMEGFKNEVADVGGEIGSSFVDAISDGMDQGDFLQKMKSWIKKMLVQSVVYTESIKAEIEAIGQAITKGIREGFTETSLHEIRRDLSWVFNEANKTVSSLDDILDKTFGGYAIGTNNALIGKNIGEKITGSIINGMDKSSFLQDMKAYFRENIIKFAVYTDEFQTRLAQIGAKVGALFSGGFSNTFAKIDTALIKDELEEMYDETAETMKGIDNLLDSIFGTVSDSIEESFDEAVEIVEEKLTTLEEVIKSFNEQIADVGGDLGSQFADSIAEGMSESDFLGKMKDWIKRMLVQSVVYTESMKSEIEAIGQAITKGIREGFTETSLHEIRRDLSWVFNEANKTVSSLDNILDRTFGGYAIGTNNALSGLHLVGEAGPELVRFRGGEQVLNAGNTQKALEGMGGTTINQSVTFNNLQDTTAYAMMNQLKQYNRQMAINGIL